MVLIDPAADLSAALALFAPVAAGVVAHRVRALDVHGEGGVEILLGGRRQHPVTGDAGVVHDDVQPAEFVDRPIDERTAGLPSR